MRMKITNTIPPKWLVLDRKKIFDFWKKLEKKEKIEVEKLKKKYNIELKIGDDWESGFHLIKDGKNYFFRWDGEVYNYEEEETYPKEIKEFSWKYVNLIGDTHSSAENYIEKLGWEEVDYDVGYKLYEKNGYSIYVPFYPENVTDIEMFLGDDIELSELDVGV